MSVSFFSSYFLYVKQKIFKKKTISSFCILLTMYKAIENLLKNSLCLSSVLCKPFIHLYIHTYSPQYTLISKVALNILMIIIYCMFKKSEPISFSIKCVKTPWTASTPGVHFLPLHSGT